MKGIKTFAQSNRCTFSFQDSTPQRPIIKTYLSQEKKEPLKTTQPAQDTFRQFRKRLNKSVDLATTDYKNKIIKKINVTDGVNESKARKKAENVSVLFTEKFYQKFINKPKGKSNNDSVQIEVTKTVKDNKTIDMQSIKHSLNLNGINVYKIQNSSSLTPVSNDKVVFSVREEDTQSKIFKRIKDGLKNKGLQLKKKERNSSIDNTRAKTPIYSAKSTWSDAKFYKKSDSVDIKNNERKAM